MSGIIRLLPEHIANQIAAGEVVERPSSVVKELMENSIDAGAKSITLNIEQAGKSLIEVIDNGKGMSPTDARMCFERHATSKISTIDDLFNLHTMGFRGEALASIASISHVEMLTRLHSDELGTRIVLEGGKVVSHETTACPPGTRIRVKNLFYNVPARRQFLKEDSTELNHIFTEFERIALANPGIKMELISNGNLIHSLHSANYFQRIEGLFGKKLTGNLLFFEERTDIVSLKGYVTSPFYASKKKKNQFFFVNGRYIRSPYFSRSVYDAFQGLIPEGSYPQFFIYLEVDPKTVDVNVHPTKTEVKFRDERDIYIILQSAIRRSIGKKVLTDELDFNVPSYIQESIYGAGVARQNKSASLENSAPSNPKRARIKEHPDPEWKELYAIFEKEHTPDLSQEAPVHLFEKDNVVIYPIPQHLSDVLPLFGKYLLIDSAEGVFLANRQRMHERVIFEEVVEKLKTEKCLPIQQLLIPEELEPGKRDYLWIKDNLEHLHRLGFELQEFGREGFLIQGVPSGFASANIVELFESLLEHLKIQLMDDQSPIHEQIAKSFSKTFCVKNGSPQSKEEALYLVNAWLKTKEPAFSPFGKPVCKFLDSETFDALFRK
ncbi:MAG: DNA mismatch repair endonuclease MutL [Bacteroidia bacterium]|nr:DNA mismatch repair endonuclease MutL [Bacteroidia bacterium]